MKTPLVAQAMVMAAGHGRRMQPLSNLLPKPALPVRGRPLVGWALDQASGLGIERVVVNLHHLPELMRKAALDACPAGVELVFSHEEELLETAGGLALARDRGLIDDAPVLVLNGDSMAWLDLTPLLEQASVGDDLVTLALLPHLDPRRWSRVAVDATGRAIGIRPPGDPEPGELSFLYAGAMVVSAAGLDRLVAEPSGLKPALMLPAIDRKRCGAAVVAGHWREVGTPRELLSVNLTDEPWIHPEARVHPTARIGPAAVGARCRVGAGAVVIESLLLEGAIIEPAATVVRSIVAGDRVKATERLVDEIRCAISRPLS